MSPIFGKNRNILKKRPYGRERFPFSLLLQFPHDPLILRPMATLTRLYPLLKQLGLDDQRSQEFIETLETGLLDQVATKTDIEKIRGEIEKVRSDLKIDIEKVRAEIEKVRAELLVKIEGTKSELIRWLFGAWVTLFLAILALFLKLPG